MTDPIRVTLSGNSTPLLPGCGECAALRARLAEAEARAKPGLPPEVLQALEDFEQEMREKTIPEIIQETKRRERLAAEARQRLMGEVGTEQALHHAWRKRAEEAEARAGRVEEAVLVTPAMLRVLRIIYMATDCSNEVYDYATLHHTQQRIADEMPRLVTSIGECYLVDGDGRLKDPMRPGRGFRLTPMGYEVLTLSDPLAYPVSDRRFYPAARAAVEGAQ